MDWRKDNVDVLRIDDVSPDKAVLGKRVGLTQASRPAAYSAEASPNVSLPTLGRPAAVV